MQPSTDTLGQDRERIISRNEEDGSNERGRNLQRGHSDGDVPSHVLGLSSRMSDGEESRENGETWIDFLRQASSTGSNIQEGAQVSTRRATIVTADRKRHFQASRDELSRRRSTNTLPFEQSAEDPLSHPNLPATLSSEPVRPLRRNNISVNIDRPLPQTPSMTSPRRHRTGEIILPRWQPDTEVIECPICGKSFGFWFRKHHCRKCGRVVCSTCSPHRITIPRQFIVHPPEDPTSGMVRAGTSQIEVVDLTGDDTGISTATPTQPVGSSHCREYQLDPALGGGQEVRLCNPCVPDPNPLPPPSYSSTNSHAPDSFPRSGNAHLVPQRLPAPSPRYSESSQTTTSNNHPVPPHSATRSYDTHTSSQYRGGHRRQTIQSLITRDASESEPAQRSPTVLVCQSFLVL